ncbi:hypothetical protein K7432_005226 [Basidiobolus ranarum]|uniref:Cytochrome b5 heme-binding domain-containing protein n=1 Tax=Basidiobolus ranarum TaxID=34480 RepID=A0ABR2W3J0_9FUNG
MLENWSYVDMLYLIAVPILLHFTLSRFYFSKATKNGKKVRFSGKDQVVEHISEEEKSQSDEEVKQEEKKATPEKKKREFPPLKPAEDYPFEATELAKFDGTNPELPIYVAIKGVVFDVTWNRTAYAPGSGYHVFAGKDASKVSL